MAKGDILLDPKHGVNPMLVVCSWCGEDTNEIALLGRLKDNSQAPMRGVLNDVPCDACGEHMAVGVTFVIINPAGEREGFFVLKQEAFDKMKDVLELEQWESINEHRRCNISTGAAKKLGFYDFEESE